MNQLARSEYEQAAALRKAVFGLLDRHLHCAGPGRNADVISALQSAANSLGKVERSLLDMISVVRNEDVGVPAMVASLNGATPVMPPAPVETFLL